MVSLLSIIENIHERNTKSDFMSFPTSLKVGKFIIGYSIDWFGDDLIQIKEGETRIMTGSIIHSNLHLTTMSLSMSVYFFSIKKK